MTTAPSFGFMPSMLPDILGLPDEGRDALMSAALDPPDAALESWHRWERSSADAATDPIANRWLPLIGQRPSRRYFL